jgi:hypothetical protein
MTGCIQVAVQRLSDERGCRDRGWAAEGPANIKY